VNKNLIMILVILIIAMLTHNSLRESFPQTPVNIWKAKTMASKVDSDGDKVLDGTKAFIKKIDITQDCNEITLNIDYNNLKNETDGYFLITASSSLKGAKYSGDNGSRSDHGITIQKNESSILFKKWITPETESFKTDRIWVDIQEIENGKFKSIIDRVKIDYKKEWNHDCKKPYFQYLKDSF